MRGVEAQLLRQRGRWAVRTVRKSMQNADRGQCERSDRALPHVATEVGHFLDCGQGAGASMCRFAHGAGCLIRWAPPSEKGGGARVQWTVTIFRSPVSAVAET